MTHDVNLIEHFSKEIETHTNNLMIFRTRIMMSLFIGPFVALGAVLVASKGRPLHLKFDCGTWLALAVILLSYFAMGIAGAWIEKHTWHQCNKWRFLIVQIARGPTSTIAREEFEFHDRLYRSYLVCYTVALMAIGSVFYLLLRLKIEPGG